MVLVPGGTRLRLRQVGCRFLGNLWLNHPLVCQPILFKDPPSSLSLSCSLLQVAPVVPSFASSLLPPSKPLFLPPSQSKIKASPTSQHHSTHIAWSISLRKLHSFVSAGCSKYTLYRQSSRSFQPNGLEHIEASNKRKLFTQDCVPQQQLPIPLPAHRSTTTYSKYSVHIHIYHQHSSHTLQDHPSSKPLPRKVQSTIEELSSSTTITRTQGAFSFLNSTPPDPRQVKRLNLQLACDHHPIASKLTCTSPK